MKNDFIISIKKVSLFIHKLKIVLLKYLTKHETLFIFNENK